MLLLAACGDDKAGDSQAFGTGGATETGDGDGDGDPVDPLWSSPNLWYSVEDKLHYIEIDADDGSVVQFVTSTITSVASVAPQGAVDFHAPRVSCSARGEKLPRKPRFHVPRARGPGSPSSR